MSGAAGALKSLCAGNRRTPGQDRNPRWLSLMTAIAAQPQPSNPFPTLEPPTVPFHPEACYSVCEVCDESFYPPASELDPFPKCPRCEAEEAGEEAPSA